MVAIENVKVVGCGGIGLCLLPNLARYLNYHEEIEGVNITLIDGDDFEPKNNARQAFEELGNKADVTVQTYEAEFRSLLFTAVAEYLTEDNIAFHIREGDIIFLCVDNHSARKLVIEECQNLDNVILIAGGNDLYDGNVMVYIREDGEDKTLPPTEYYDEIKNPPEDDVNPGDVDEDREGGCADNAEAAPQILWANNMAAALMGNAFYSVVEGEHGTWGDICFDCKTNNTMKKDHAMPKTAARIG